ncbi:MAG: hypothetical protein K9M96_01320 [Deltaproteobacteria bacterium]|nr:hypothetical protein [Deltaproteobacteria bacterium]
MENKRYISTLYSVFDLPHNEELHHKHPEGSRDKPTRVMMVYDRALNRRTFQVLDHGLSESVRKRLECWLTENSHICDAINGLS